jgi:aminopeptidase N
MDPHSCARPDEAAVEHLSLDLAVDFDRRKLAGRATLRLARRPDARRLLLDTRDLDVRNVTLGEGGGPARPERGAGGPPLGRPLAVELAPGTRTVEIEYETSPSAAAVQWLEPRQTAGGKQPFLFTQSQAILARTWVPCQDTPGVRMTYDATVRVPKGLLAVMSAENPSARAADGVYRFRMPQAIPSYLLALAVGDLEFRSMGPRTGVYAEPATAARAAHEFAETERMIDAAEKLYGPYLWGRYDLLVLPPSFPFGGMENPRLTFATPTILAGDRSLTSLVAHELAHSWSGNLVTNATWNDFWLNEGFTVYFERRIMEELYGRPYAEMLALLGLQDLRACVKDKGATSPDTRLLLDLAGRDPDEAVNEIAYEKGHSFLRLLEGAVGRGDFDAFLREYFAGHRFQSMTTGAFLDELRVRLLRGRPGLEEKLGVDEWLHGPGLPANCPEPRSDAFLKVERQVEAWKAGTRAGDLPTKGWSTHEWLHFLRQLPDPIAPARLADLDGAFGLTTSGNSEVLNAWFPHAIAAAWEPAMPALERFLTSQGRRKFLKPLYKKLAETPEGLERARRIYEKARPGYHSVSTGTIDGILGVKA